MYNYYIKSGDHQIDHIIAPGRGDKSDDYLYHSTDKNLYEKICSKILKTKFIKLFSNLNNILKYGDKFIIQIIDNYGLVLPLHQFLIDKNLRSKVHIQFFYHGFAPFYENFAGRSFYEAINEMVFLTFKSYQKHIETYTTFTPICSVLPNGVDTSKFFKLSYADRAALRNRNDIINEKLIFLWCSQDRPKKGLDFILGVWKILCKTHSNIELWVIGASRNLSIPRVKFYGKIPNPELPKYYQMADIYLFPSLWHEGFGLSLLEALKCGCFCIASNNGGIPEVLDYGKYGKLVDRPNMIGNWVKEIEETIKILKAKSNNSNINMPETNKYSLEKWTSNKNDIINNAKNYLPQL